MKVGEKYEYWIAEYYTKIFTCIYVSETGDAVLEDNEGNLRVVPINGQIFWKEAK